MKFTNQFMTTVSLCVLIVVVTVLVGVGSSFFQMGALQQQRQVDALAQLVDYSWQQGVDDQPDLERLLPSLLDVNGITDFTVLRGDAVAYRATYIPASAYDENLFAMNYVVPLSAEPHLSAHFELQPPFYNIDHSFSALAGVFIAILLVLAGTFFMLRWFRYQLRGAELLNLRGQYILQNKLNLLSHQPEQEWPQQASQALDKVLLELKEANKERSRFDAFMRANVFVDKKLGMGNRVFFDNRLEAALHDPTCNVGALLLIEVQDLQQINYYLGYECGDELLLAIARYMGHFVQRIPGALQARYSGNTFALLMPNMVENEAQEAARQVMKVLRRVNWPDEVPDPALYIGGVCFRVGEQELQVREEAELALRSAALQEGTGYFIYAKGVTEESMGKGTVRWRTLLSRLLAQHKIRLGRQGIYLSPDQAPMMYELLARIQDEQGREIPAGHFLPMAEKCGLLKELDQEIVQQTLSLLRDAGPDERLAVNLCADSLLHQPFYNWLIFELLQLPKALLNKLVIDLSEAQVSRHFQALKKPLRGLKSLGCGLAVDHAGQDVVSTQYIKDYQLNYLKLHPSLVRDINHKPINQMAVSSLIGNCVGSQTQLIAMGVETEEEWQCLIQLGAYAGQGYFFNEHHNADATVSALSVALQAASV